MEGTAADSNFVDQQYTFTTISSFPLQLKIMVGTINGAWINQISIEKI